MTTDNETYTYAELDELSGGLLYLGAVHTTLGSLLDITSPIEDGLELIGFLGHLPPVFSSDELLPATLSIIDETVERLSALRSATAAAYGYVIEAANDERQRAKAEFDSIVRGLD